MGRKARERLYVLCLGTINCILFFGNLDNSHTVLVNVHVELIQRVEQKTGLFLSLVNLAMVSGRKMCYLSNVLEFCPTEVLKLHTISFFMRESRMLRSSLPSSGRPSVCRTRELYQNDAS